MANFYQKDGYISTLGSGRPAGFDGPDNITDISTTAAADFYNNAYAWEPKYQHKFVMLVDDVPSYLIKASAKPSMTNGEVVLDHINVKRKVKGKSSWNTIAITLYDAIVPSGAQAVMKWVRLHHESATGRDGYSSQYKKEITLQQLSGHGEVVEEWKLKGCYLQDVNFGSLDWASEDVVTIEATLNYDWAFLNY